jgi:putative FmdB family regulatory protein
MSIRVYRCETCGVFEKREKFKDMPLTICPTCAKLIKQVYSAPMIIFRGGGWANKNEKMQ